jgi:hypothetical protein
MSTVNFYRIVCLQGGATYIGSTCSPIHVVLHKYENNYRRYLDGKINFHPSFIVLQRGNYTIQLIDSIYCNDKKIRNTIEKLYILNEDAVNQCPPSRDMKQYKQDNKEKIKEQNKQYHQDNKEKRNEYSKQYRQLNKEKIKQNKNEMIDCACGKQYTRTHKARHMKSKKHIAYEQN